MTGLESRRSRSAIGVRVSWGAEGTPTEVGGMVPLLGAKRKRPYFLVTQLGGDGVFRRVRGWGFTATDPSYPPNTTGATQMPPCPGPQWVMRACPESVKIHSAAWAGRRASGGSLNWNGEREQ